MTSRTPAEIEEAVDLSLCAHCGERMPVCIGQYESSDNPVEPACDECCGHGNEDGWCKPIGEYVEQRTAERIAAFVVDGWHDHSWTRKEVAARIRAGAWKGASDADE